ncbi:MAG: vitamin B12 dependent-methionine synthase activation domain-containing protein [Bacteroidota bacterium]|jgi:hypothetical protein
MPSSIVLDVATFTPSFRDMGVDRALVESDLGYRDGEAPDMIGELIDEILPLIPSHIALQCGYGILPAGSITLADDSVSFDELLFATGPIITSQLKRSTSLALFVSTAGPRLEQWSGKLMAEGDMMRGYIVDAIASEYVEQASVWLEKQIAGHVASSGWKMTNRYSPGYCDWPVSEQHKLFSLLPERFCGITLTESALMVPIKSLSGIIGLGPDVKRGAFQCNICDLKDCFRRREEPEPATERE